MAEAVVSDPVIRPRLRRPAFPLIRGRAAQALPVAPPIGSLRRCTFRRLDGSAGGRVSGLSYQVMCLYGDRVEPLPLGNLAQAQAACAACAAPGIFRPDED